MNFLVFSSFLKQFFIPSFPIIQKVQFSKFILAFPSIQKRFLPCHFSASRGCNFLAFLYHFPTSENAFYVSICKSMYSIFSRMAAAYLVDLQPFFVCTLFFFLCAHLFATLHISFATLQTFNSIRTFAFFSFGVLRIFFWSTPYRSKYQNNLFKYCVVSYTQTGKENNQIATLLFPIRHTIPIQFKKITRIPACFYQSFSFFIIFRIYSLYSPKSLKQSQ